MENNKKEEYKRVCFQINEKRTEIENLRTDIFILNPKIDELVKELVELEDIKKKLEEEIND